MIPLYTIITFMVCHWIFDFFLQTEEMSQGKSKSNKHLVAHVRMYSLGLAVMVLLNFPYFYPGLGIAWAVFNAICHFFTDYVSSRATSCLWKEGNVHDFFVTVGLDQLIHYSTLFGSFYYCVYVVKPFLNSIQ